VNIKVAPPIVESIDVFSMIESIIEPLTEFILRLISAFGYPGIVFLMTLESAGMPVPSEVVMPFSGFLVYQGQMSLLWTTIAGALGNLLGSVIAYYIGMYGGRAFIFKYGKYVFINNSHLHHAEEWFAKYGEKAVLMGRLLPVIRTFISFPAGMAEMNFNRFVLGTVVGSLPWCFVLTYAGVILREHWEDLLGLFHLLDFVVVFAVVAALLWVIVKSNKKRKRNK
jgi:membrane protein DedA with SNARE-associated domain